MRTYDKCATYTDEGNPKMQNTSKMFFRYVPVGSIDIDWGVHVTTTGFSIIPPNSQYPFARHPSLYHFTWERGRVLDEYQIIYITSGNGVFESSYGSMTVAEGSVIFLFPGVWHRYRPNRKTGWNEYWVGLNGDFPDRMVEKGFISPKHPVWTIGFDEAIVDHYMQLVHLVDMQPIGYQQIISSMSLQILAMILADIRSLRAGDDHTAALMRRAKTMLAERVDAGVDMEKLAKELNISYPHFRRIFKQYTSLAPHQYFLQLRINRAKELLRGTELPIKTIAFMLGFENPYYFSRFFRKKTGLPPGDWRHGKHQDAASNSSTIQNG